MKKTLSLILALTLCMALAVPAMAAKVKSDKHTYTLSNDVVGTTTFVYSESQWDEDGNPVLDADGNQVYADVTHTVYLVPAGTVVTNNDLFMSYSVYYFDKSIGQYDGAPGNSTKSLTVDTIDKYEWIDSSEGLYSDLIYCVGTINAEFQAEAEFGLFTAEDEVYLKAVDSSATPAPAPAPATDKPAAETPAPATPAATTPAAVPAGSGSYTAQKYDTYGKLAVNYYGSYAYTKALQKANGNKALKEGMTVILPDKLGDAVRLAPAVAGAGEKLYTVLAGDTLGTIAKAYYGNSAMYKAIFERNADRLKNANTIYEGQIIVLPAK